MKKYKWSGERLKSLRQIAGISLTELAEKTGLSTAAIMAYENGKTSPGIEALVTLAAFYIVPVDYITGHLDEPEMFGTYPEFFQRVKKEAYETYLLKQKSGLVEGKYESPWPYNLVEEIRGWEFSGRPYEEILSNDQIQGLDEALASLDPISGRLQKMVRMHYQDGRTLDEIGKEFDLSRNRVRQIINRGIRYLRHPSRKNLVFMGVKGYGLHLEGKSLEARKEELIREKEKLDAFEQSLMEQRKRLPEDIPVDLAEVPVDELELSARSYNCLTHANITNLAQLKAELLKEGGLMKIRNLGKKSYEEIYAKAQEYGLV